MFNKFGMYIYSTARQIYPNLKEDNKKLKSKSNFLIMEAILVKINKHLFLI